MRISNKSLACDGCGLIMNNDFIYYSCDARLITVHGSNRQSIDSILLEPISKSNEICQQCFNKLGKIVVSINTKEIKPSRSIRNYDLCELTGVHLKGDYEYYYIIIDKVDVASSNTYICVKCKATTEGKPVANCKCGHTAFINPSKVNVSNRLLEFKAQLDLYNNMVSHKHQATGSWSTST